MALQRSKIPMPADIKKRLANDGLMSAYNARPEYQQNDYLGWIIQARRGETRTKRLEQMLTELKDGTKYMKMDYKGE